MAWPLLTTKLHIPRARPEWVPRPRLLARLDEGLERRLTLVSAPAGYGKTALLSEWLRPSLLSGEGCLGPAPSAAKGARAGWLSLDENDNDPARFWSHVVAALQTIPQLQEAGIGEAMLATLRVPRLAGAVSVPIEELLAGLINEVAAEAGPVVLVLDDYHVIATEPIHAGIGFLVEHLPAQMRLVLSTRADPPLPLARLRGRGELTELRQRDLRFLPGEVAQVLSRVAGLELDAESIEALAEHTEGWIAGLQMAALSLRGHEDVAGFIRAFTGSNRYVMDYLVEEVLHRQPEIVQAFLLQTSILERLSAPLCDAVIDPPLLLSEGAGLRSGESSQSILEHLERANLFIQPLDDERNWYRYHQLFAGALRERLQQEEPQLVPLLHHRASAWYEQSGLLPSAIDHAVAAEDLPRAAELIERAADACLLRGELATFLKWVEALPADSMRSRPLLCVLQAGAMLGTGQPLAAVEARLREVEEADTAGAVTSEVDAFRFLIATFQGRVQSSIELARRALEGLSPNREFLRTLLTNNLGIAYMMQGDVAKARETLEEAARTGQGTGNVTIVVGAMSNLAGLCMTQGHLRQAGDLYRRALELARDRQGRHLPIAGKALLGLGELSREWNDLEAAARYLKEAIELLNRQVSVGALAGYLSLARIRQARGDAAGARAMNEQARRIAGSFDTTDVDDLVVAAQQAHIYIAQGDLAPARVWAEARGLIGRDWRAEPPPVSPKDALLDHYRRKCDCLTLARLHLAEGRPSEALALLDWLLPLERRSLWQRSVVEAEALRALALHACGDVGAAVQAIGQVLRLARPEGYVRVFVDEGAPMARLLYEAAAHGIEPEYAGELLGAFTDAQLGPAPVGEPAEARGQLVEPLSRRELEVLVLIAEGLANQEIAQRLVVAPSTVKVHTRNIYGKLMVSSRTQAVAKGRALGILPGGDR